jgi:hypothetical protein
MSLTQGPRSVFLLRLTGAVVASAAFGLIAAASFPHWYFGTAVGLGFLFGTAFIGGTGYRIILGVVRVSMAPAPASWSGATAGSALYAAALWAILAGTGHDGVFVLLSYGVAINIAYLPVKFACLQVGCCRVAHGHVTPANIDLRKLEVGLTIGVLAASAAIAPLDGGAAAITAIGGHLGVRAISRHLRNRGSWGWPPLRQPGSEIAPLALLLCLSAIATF